jgi:hypothetical protein
VVVRDAGIGVVLALTIMLAAACACKVDAEKAKARADVEGALNAKYIPVCTSECTRPCVADVVVGGMMEIECEGVPVAHVGDAGSILQDQCAGLGQAGFRLVRLDWKLSNGGYKTYWAKNVEGGNCKLASGAIPR